MCKLGTRSSAAIGWVCVVGSIPLPFSRRNLGFRIWAYSNWCWKPVSLSWYETTISYKDWEASLKHFSSQQTGLLYQDRICSELKNCLALKHLSVQCCCSLLASLARSNSTLFCYCQSFPTQALIDLQFAPPWFSGISSCLDSTAGHWISFSKGKRISLSGWQPLQKYSRPERCLSLYQWLEADHWPNKW